MKLLGVFESNAAFWSYPPVIHICYDIGTIHMDSRSTSWSEQPEDEVQRNYELKCKVGVVWERIL